MSALKAVPLCCKWGLGVVTKEQTEVRFGKQFEPASVETRMPIYTLPYRKPQSTHHPPYTLWQLISCSKEPPASARQQLTNPTAGTLEQKASVLFTQQPVALSSMPFHIGAFSD